MSDSPHHALATVDEFISITTSLSTERDINQLLSMIVASACRIAQADTGLIYVLDSTKQFLVVKAVHSRSSDPKLSEFESVPLFVGGERNLIRLGAYSAFTGKLTNIPNIYEYTGFGFDDIYAFDRKYKYHTQSVLAVPLRNHENITVGILQLINRIDSDTNEVIPFPGSVERIVTAFASQAAVAIDNAQLTDKNKRLIDLLNHTNKELEEENQQLRKKIQTTYDFTRIVGQGEAMQGVFNLMKKIFDSNATVLLGGQTGTGKELIAQTIHYNGKRSKGEFVAQNCAALPENLLESELFGFKKGAFSGANSDKIGLIESSDGGTLFLDEIGDMPMALQAKLLRVLQEREVRPLGALTPKKVNIRVIAATHCNLLKKIEAGEFREDLYYRLSVFPINLPPLSERKEDMPSLLQHFLKMFSQQYAKSIGGYSPKSLDTLIQHEYPGNIRELRNVVERAVLLCEDGGNILQEHLPENMQEAAINNGLVIITDKNIADEDETDAIPPDLALEVNNGLKGALESYEATLLRKKLDECSWNQTDAAEKLKIARRTLIEKMKRYDIRR